MKVFFFFFFLFSLFFHNNNNQMKKTQCGRLLSPLLTPLLLVLCAALAGAERACTAADWVAQYTECRVSSNTRDLLYYKNPATDACTGGVACPAHVFGLRCDIACGAGHYLPPGTTACAACPAGTFAVGGGARATDFARFPRAGAGDAFVFATHAVGATGARIETDGLWHVADGGLALRSGRVNNSQSSYLTLPIHVCFFTTPLTPHFG